MAAPVWYAIAMFGGPDFFDLTAWQWLNYGVQGLAVVVCLGVIARALLVPSDVRRQCCCGACGHGIVDTASNRCPECGGQLTKVGISTPAMAVRLRGGLGWALLAWTVACGFLLQIAADYVQQSAWQTMNASAFGAPGAKTQHDESGSFEPSTFGVSASAADRAALRWRIGMSLSYVEDGGEAESGEATLNLRKSGTLTKSELTLDIAAGTFEIKDPEGKSILTGAAPDVNQDAIKAWFGAADIATEGEPMASAMRDAELLVRACLIDPLSIDSLFQGFGADELGALRGGSNSSSSGPVGFQSGMSFTRSGPDYWTTQNIAILAALGLVYIAGCAFIWRRHRRLLA